MDTAVIFAANNAYAPGVIINIAQIEHLHPDFADKYLVYVDNWSQENLEKLNSICRDKIQVNNYSEKDFWNKHPELAGIDKVSKFIKQYTHFKFAFSDYATNLKNFEQVIFLDSDFIILDKITELKNIKEQIAFRSSIFKISHKDTHIQNPNGGLIILNKGFPYLTFAKKFNQYILETASDEVSIAKACFDLNIPIGEICCSFNYVPQARNTQQHQDVVKKQNLKIFHTAGVKKIWNSPFYRTLFPQYVELLNKFKLPISSNGDSRYKKFKLYSIFENSQAFKIFQLQFLERIPLLDRLTQLPQIKIDVNSIFDENLHFSHTSSFVRFNFRFLAGPKYRLRCIVPHEENLQSFIDQKLEHSKNVQNFTLSIDSERNLNLYYQDFNYSLTFFDKVIDSVNFFANICLEFQATYANRLLQNYAFKKFVHDKNILETSQKFSIRKVLKTNPISLTDLKDGDVLLCVADPNDCVSWAITYFTNAEVSHAALTYDAKNNVLVDAAGNHVRTALITDYLNDGRPIHVMRYQYNQNLKPVLASAKNFLDKQEPYANSTLVMLAAVLLLTKNIPQTSLAKKALTKLIKLVCGELMKLINKKVYPNSEPFVCSQFVAENFNRAQDYEPFIKYPLFFNDDNNITKLYGQSQGVKLYNYLYDYGIDVNQTIKFGAQEQQLSNALGDSLETICSILHQIIIFFDNERALLASNAPTQELHRNMNAELLSADEIKKNDIELKSSISNLAASFYALHQTPENLAKLSAIKGKDILEYLKTLENYFVTPGDLLFNCPALRYIGTLFSTEPNKIGK